MWPVVISLLIFAITLIVIFTEKLHRTVAALAGAVLMIFAGLIFGFFTQEQALAAIDLNTLGLLLGMMILVSLLEPTGFFQFLAVWVGRLSKGSSVRLLLLLGGVTTVISMFLPNVTTVVLIAPVTILISEILGISPQPFLMAEALLSNTGGVATLVGDPPNVLIGSAAGFTFDAFLVHSLPLVAVIWLVAVVQLVLLFREPLRAHPPVDPEVILGLNPKEALTDPKAAFRVLIAVGLAVAAFLMEELLHLHPWMVAIAAAAVALVWLNPHIEETLKRIDWDILIFFGALFVMVGGLEAAGVMHLLSVSLSGVGKLPPVLIGVTILWIVAILSAVVDNIPITIALIPVIQEMGRMGVNINSLWWALAFGAGFGGNGTIIGSTANVVVASLSQRTRFPITAAAWQRYGLPVMLLTCAAATVLYVLVSLTFGWG